MRTRVTGRRRTWYRGRLRHALMATTPLILTHARPTVIMGLAGSPVECSSASGHGAGVDADITGAVATTEADAATMVAGALPAAGTVAGRPTPDAEVFAAEQVTDTPEAHGPTVVLAALGLTVVDAPMAVVHATLVEADAATVDAEMPTAVVDVALEAEDMPSAAAAMVEAATVVADTVVDIGRFRDQLATLAADSTCCRPRRF